MFSRTSARERWLDQVKRGEGDITWTQVPLKSFIMLLELKKRPSWSLWHKRFGHVNYQRIQSMAASGLIPLSSMSVTQESHGCVTFQLSKNAKLPSLNRQAALRHLFPLVKLGARHPFIWFILMCGGLPQLLLILAPLTLLPSVMIILVWHGCLFQKGRIACLTKEGKEEWCVWNFSILSS